MSHPLVIDSRRSGGRQRFAPAPVPSRTHRRPRRRSSLRFAETAVGQILRTGIYGSRELDVQRVCAVEGAHHHAGEPREERVLHAGGQRQVRAAQAHLYVPRDAQRLVLLEGEIDRTVKDVPPRQRRRLEPKAAQLERAER